ncbi:CGNR zinc finger domain-containing protein [Streptomyces sp. NPDC051018]|uniref:CGNR zinc finger domain-containing protein n=1 Tax=Streptomyces sp. NPDC051018 TaxID=3365639 RepID=UPI0037BCA245
MSEAARGFILRPSNGRPFHFDPGALCLEFLLLGGPGILARFDVLHEPEDLVRWAAESRLPGGLDPAVTPEEVRDARVLRDAVYRLAAARAYGDEPPAGDIAVVNAVAEQAPPVPRLTAEGARAWAPGVTGTQLLSAVARDAVDLFSGPYADRVRECGTHNCYLLFVDTSRPGRRRWCSMERCGNRQKVRAHRARHADAADAAGATKDADVT